MEYSKPNGHAVDGMDEPRVANSAEIDASDYMYEEQQPTDPPNTEAYTQPEEDLVSIVPVGLGAITVRSRPPKDDWFQSHPDGAMSTGMLLLKGKMGELYAIKKELITLAGQEISKALIKASVTACMTIDGVKFLWAIIHPSGNASHQHYDNAMDARSLSRGTWIRFYWDANRESHVVVTPKNNSGAKPQWPENYTLGDWIAKAFKGDRLIDNLDHNLIRKIRGEL